MVGFVLVEEAGGALSQLYRLSGRTQEAATLSRVREVAERSASMLRSAAPSSNDAWVRSLYQMTLDPTVARGLRWEYFVNLTTIAPCLNLNRIVFGVGEDYERFIEDARESLVRWPSEASLFEVARYGWTGNASAYEPGIMARVAAIYMDSGPNSCARFVQHMQAQEGL